MSVIFPKWMNVLPTVAALGTVGGLTGVVGGFWYYATPKFFEVGYMPKQPGGGFSHQIHAGKLGMDCRYCHTKVEQSSEANIPNVATCYGCHAENKLSLYSESETHKTRTEFIREAYAEDQSIPWRRIHKLPDYVRNFPHQVHIQRGVSCYSCHGQITAMPVVFQAQSLSMSWCLDCHRDPEPHLVPPERVTQLQWVEAHIKEREGAKQAPRADAQQVLDSLMHVPPQNCGACHY